MCPVPRLSLAEMNSLPEDKPDGSFHTGPNSGKARVTGTGTSYAGTNKKRKGNKNQCCGAGAGGAEINCDLEPEPKLNF